MFFCKDALFEILSIVRSVINKIDLRGWTSAPCEQISAPCVTAQTAFALFEHKKQTNKILCNLITETTLMIGQFIK